MVDLRKMPNGLIVLGQTMLCGSIFVLYMKHIRSVFESRTHITVLSQFEREAMLRGEDALHYSFYKTITDSPNFVVGLIRLSNLSGIEYPNTVNVLHTFHVFPEVIIGGFYHLMQHLPGRGVFAFLPCWSTSPLSVSSLSTPQDEIVECQSAPFQFYLESVWFCGGVTIILIYLYALHLNGSVQSALYAAVCYLMSHSYAGIIYEKPMARENFALPLILMQMFYLSMYMENSKQSGYQRENILMTVNLSVCSAIALLCWHFSGTIFAIQILLMTLPWLVESFPTIDVDTFQNEYAWTHLMGSFMAYYLSEGHSRYLYSWQVGPALGLMLLTLLRYLKRQLLGKHEYPVDWKYTGSFKYYPHNTFFLIIMLWAIYTYVLDSFLSSGAVRTDTMNDIGGSGSGGGGGDMYYLYHNLVMRWFFHVPVNFTTSMLACNKDLSHLRLHEIWNIIYKLLVKPYYTLALILTVKAWLKLRNTIKHGSNAESTDTTNGVSSNESNSREREERAAGRNEEGSGTASVVAPEDKPEPVEHVIERAKKYLLEDYIEENHLNLSDMSNLQNEKRFQEWMQILSNCDYDYERFKQERERLSRNKSLDHTDFFNEVQMLRQEIKRNRGQSSSEVNNEQQKVDETKSPEVNQPPKNSRHKYLPNLNSTNPRVNAFTVGLSVFDLRYACLQMIVFTFFGVAVRRLFFLCYVQFCILASTVYRHLVLNQKRDKIWLAYVYVTCIMMPLFYNVHNEYYPEDKLKRTISENRDVNAMLDWILLHTEENAVFGGPIDVIGTVHLITKRSIVNHANLQLRPISHKTDIVYSAYGRQPSAEIYNHCAQLKIQYLIVSAVDCNNRKSNEGCDYLSLWDKLKPGNKQNPQFCSDVLVKNVPSFLIVFRNEHYAIIKIFSQSIQLNLEKTKLPEQFI